MWVSETTRPLLSMRDDSDDSYYDNGSVSENASARMHIFYSIQSESYAEKYKIVIMESSYFCCTISIYKYSAKFNLLFNIIVINSNEIYR